MRSSDERILCCLSVRSRFLFIFYSPSCFGLVFFSSVFIKYKEQKEREVYGFLNYDGEHEPPPPSVQGTV